MKPKVVFKKRFSLLRRQALLLHPCPDLFISLVSTSGPGSRETPCLVVAHIDIWLMLHVSCLEVVSERGVKIN